MKHIELLYQRLQEKEEIKQLRPEPEIRYFINRIKTRQPLYTFFRTKQGTQLQIKRAQLIGNITKYKNVFVAKPTDLTFRVEYYNAGRTVRALVYQQIGESKVRQIVIFGSGATYRLDVKHKFDKPEKMPLVADIRRRRWRSDAHFEQVFTIGLADDRPRSVNTYPEPNAENEILDIKPKWEEGAYVYPQPPKDFDIEIKPRVVQFISGLFKWDIAYRVPIEPAKVRCSYTVKNNSDRKVRIEEWSLMVEILYDDMRHVSYGVTKAGYGPRTIAPGGSTTYEFDASLPEWVYGYVTITHAMRFYKDEMFVYGGGPIWNFKLGRVILP